MDTNQTSLESFRQKHGQLAYNSLMKAVGRGGGQQQQPTNSGLSAIARQLMSPQHQANLAKNHIARVRGSADVPLTNQGAAEADLRGKQFAARGGLDQLVTSPLQRAKNTAAAISRYTDTPIHVDDRVMPWKLGAFEGEPVDNVKNMIANLANNHPDAKAPGMSPYSSAQGESFNNFKQRFIGNFLGPLMEAHAQDPRGKIGIVSHLRDVLAAKSWIDHGARKDLQFPHHDVNYESATAPEEKPASVFHIHPDGDKWKFEDVDMDKPDPLSSGIYMIRHGETAWNSNGSGETS